MPSHFACTALTSGRQYAGVGVYQRQLCYGAWLGVVVFHHKTLHASFRYGVPLILLAQVALAAWIILDKL